LKVFVVYLFCVLVKHVFVTLLYYSGVCYTTHTGYSGSIICYQNVVCFSLYWFILCYGCCCMEGPDERL